MSSRILVPVDGSAFSRKAAREAAKLARSAGSKLVLFHAEPDCRSFLTEVFSPPGRLPKIREKTRSLMESRGRAALAAAAQAAGLASRRVEQHMVVSDWPYEAIVAAAKHHHCDLIVMASRKRAVVSGWALGSETQKVLARSRIPVLVVR